MRRTEYISLLKKRMNEKRRFIQVVTGARQVGKTTIIQQFIDSTTIPLIDTSADDALPGQGKRFIEQVWETARFQIKAGRKEVVIVIDEVQKIEGWSETVKRLWDEDTKRGNKIKVILSGSSRLLIQEGLTESLMGRYELIFVPHWSYTEMKKAFGFTLDQYIYFGGYPGAAEFIHDEIRWKNYVRNSIITPSITKDILLLTKVNKPALLQQLFELGSYYSAQILSYTSMLGQLTDAGNTTTLADYVNLLDQSGLLAGLQKYSGSLIHTKGSSPKFQVYNNALMSAASNLTFEQAKNDATVWGRLVESCCGSHIVRLQKAYDYKTYYWREKDDEMDFVIKNKESVSAIEVKSGSRFLSEGTAAFKQRFPNVRTYVVSYKKDSSGITIPLVDFLNANPGEL